MRLMAIGLVFFISFFLSLNRVDVFQLYARVSECLLPWVIKTEKKHFPNKRDPRMTNDPYYNGFQTSLSRKNIWRIQTEPNIGSRKKYRQERITGRGGSERQQENFFCFHLKYILIWVSSYIAVYRKKISLYKFHILLALYFVLVCKILKRDTAF